jgi:hypothetical protein
LFINLTPFVPLFLREGGQGDGFPKQSAEKEPYETKSPPLERGIKGDFKSLSISLQGEPFRMNPLRKGEVLIRTISAIS